jgi:hypothetical protein
MAGHVAGFFGIVSSVFSVEPGMEYEHERVCCIIESNGQKKEKKR